MKTKDPILVSIYAPHYFNGEYNLKKLIQDSGNSLFWGFEVLDAKTISLLIESKLAMSYSFIQDWISNKYNIDKAFLTDDCPENIIGIQFYESKSTRAAIIETLYNMAIQTMDNAGGDDDFFDYTPGLVDCICCLLSQLGAEAKAKDLQNEIETRGHNN